MAVSACLLQVSRKKCIFIYNMQTQDAPAEILFKLWPWLEENAKALIIGVVAIVVVVGGYFFIQTQHEQTEINAGGPDDADGQSARRRCGFIRRCPDPVG